MDYLDRLIHKLRTDNYGDNPPIKLGLWEFGLLPIYNEFVVIVDDERYELYLEDRDDIWARGY